MNKIIETDLLEMQGVICHQVNCQGVMGSGLAKQIVDRWPSVLATYRIGLRNGLGLGNCQIIDVSPNTVVANLFGQYDYNRGTRRRLMTKYTALEDAIKIAVTEAERRNLQLYIPYMMGCDRAGGSWDEVTIIIKNHAPNAIICRLPSA